ncbi:MAG TPA: hypothetical protein VK212_04495 [Lentimicrobium sp.]|nr:hypothetical protein [Lentimicrobium sp.]
MNSGNNNENLHKQGPCTGLVKNGHSVVKANFAICPALTANETGYVKAAYGEKIGKMERGSALLQLLDIVSMALAELNQAPAGNTEVEQNESLRIITKLIYADLMNYFPQVTIAEITISVKNGLRRQYGDFYGFNTLTVHKFIKNYLEDVERMEAIKKQNRFLEAHEEPKKEYTKEELDSMGMESLKTCYQSYLSTGSIFNCGNVVYEYAVRKGFIKQTLEEMREIYARALQMVKANKLSEQQNVLYSFRNKSDAATLDFEAKMLAREMSLKKYFDSLGTQGIIPDSGFRIP